MKMEIFGHCATFFARIIREGIALENALKLLEEHSAKLCLTDAIRYTIRGDNVVQFGRGYSHFTDGCGMTLPFGENLKNFTNIHETTFITGVGYISKFADKPTDFARFIRMNPALFEKGNDDWGSAILSHLQQDVTSDTLYQHDISICNTADNKVTYPYTKKEVDGEQFRKAMYLTNTYIHHFFVEYIKSLTCDEFSEEKFLTSIKASFDRWYSKGMAENTKKYLNMDHRVFSATDEELKKLAEEVCSTGMFSSIEHLNSTCQSLFEDAMVNLNPMINHIIRLK